MACHISSVSSDSFKRLPLFAKPSHYSIKLSPDLQKFTFDGEEVAEIEILEKTDKLKLYSSEINIKNADLTLADGSVLRNLEVEYDKKWTTITLKMPKEIAPQKAKVSLNFNGELNDKMRGFYRSSYKDSAGKEHFLASTQFESTYARLAFPCWDEPLYKATFDVTLVVNQGLTALSNMNVISEQACDGNKKSVKFARTPLMSTYLVAFAVGELEYLETKTKRDCLVRVYTVPGKKEQGNFALELGTKALDWYSDWFGIDYPLPKCDLIAIPDFSMGAMENWGLVTYREVALLVDQKKSSTRQKSRVALVVAHELAHLWFGDLVTMKWWTDLWLKEGFASFMEYMFVGANYPEFRIWLHFLNDEMACGFGLDALKSSHPIEVEIDNPNELDEIYDNITYAKSNSINRMLCNYLGEETFQKGLQIYLKRFQYGNAVTVDLWNALSEASGQDIKTMMSTWTKQMGFPVVKVSQKIENDKRILQLKQSRFIADGSSDETNSLWQVPITISTASAPSMPKYKVLLTEKEQTITIDSVKPTDWIKLNVGTTGFYRVFYPNDMFQALLPAFEKKELSVLDRFGIVNDLFALVKAGQQSAKQFLSLLASAKNEDDFNVWSALDSGISCIANVLSHFNPSVRSKFDNYIIKVLEPVADRLGWEAKVDEDSQVALLRALILGRLGRCGHQETIKIAREKFIEHIEKKTELHPDLRLAIYGMMGKHFGKEGFEQLKNIYETSGFGEVERNCITAMPQTADLTILKKIFKYGVEEGKIRSQDIIYLFFGACVNKSGQEFVWNYFKDHTNILLEKFGGANSSLFQHCFKGSADCHCSSAVADEVQHFVCSNLDAEAAKTLDRTTRQIIESIHLNEQLLKRDSHVIRDYLVQEGF